MDNAKSQLVDRLKTANSVLITVSRNPSVDQLAACIGLTLLVNKLGKHGSAVFSGEVPSTIEFLKPEDTFEKTADSLRDFIIALDKNKADKLRYKVEDQMVKIFISPYRTSLSEKDLEFSQGDFNIELVIALGVVEQDDLDQAIITHGRILHDATIACINTSNQSSMGTINWRDQAASSLCELVTDLAEVAGENLIDEQIATALLTGIIAETDRFSNEKTTSQTMSVSAKLMSAGANQQLVATNLAKEQEVKIADANKGGEKKSGDNGTLSISHSDGDLDISTLPAPADNPPEPENEQPGQENNDLNSPNAPRIITEPPTLGGTLTANSVPERYDPSTDPLSNIMLNSQQQVNNNTVPPAPQPTASEQTAQAAPAVPQTAYTPPPATWTPPTPPEPAVPPAPAAPAEPEKTLNELEAAVDSPHLKKQDLDNARDQVEAILAESPGPEPKAEQSLNAVPLGEPLHEGQNSGSQEQKPAQKDNNTTGLDPSLFSEVPTKNDQAPPVPPPINFPINPQGNNDNTPK